MPTTTRWGWRYPALADDVDVPDDIKNLATDLDTVAVDDQGVFSSRPVSTVGAPGKRGRYYFATDTNRLYRDFGTGWDEIVVEPKGLLNGYRTLHTAGAAAAIDTWGTNLVGLGHGIGFLSAAAAAHTTALKPFSIPSTNPYLATNLTPKMRVVAAIITNGTGSGVVCEVALRSVTWAGAADVITPTINASAVTGSTASSAPFAPPQNSAYEIISSDFDVPASGSYLLVFKAAAIGANNSFVVVQARLDLHYV